MQVNNPPVRQTPLFLIDGYNLWWNTGESGPENDDGSLQGARESLIQWLLNTLSKDLVRKTVLVFDAKTPPANRGFLFDRLGLTVHFAVGYPDADTLMECYIQQHQAPRNLTVVSSDHRIQRAAIRKRATAVDADRWARHIQHQFLSTNNNRPEHSKANTPLTEHEVLGWMKGFGLNSQNDSKQLEQEIKHGLRKERRSGISSPQRRKK